MVEPAGLVAVPLAYYKKALTLSKEIGNKQHQFSSFWGIGVTYTNADDDLLNAEGIPLSNRYEKALEMLNNALTLAKDIDDLTDLQDVYEALSHTYEKMDDYPKSYEAFKKYIIFRDSASGDVVKKEVTRREIQYDYDKKEAVLKVEQQLTVEQLERQKLLSQQQQQTLTLKEQALALSNKEKDLQHLAFLKEKAEKQEKEQQLSLAEKDKQLQAADIKSLVQEKALQIKALAEKNALNALLIAILGLIVLGCVVFYLWQRTKQAKKHAAEQLQFTQQLLNNTEEERSRIARDLHDGISSELLTLKRTMVETSAAQRIDNIIRKRNNHQNSCPEYVG